MQLLRVPIVALVVAALALPATARARPDLRLAAVESSQREVLVVARDGSVSKPAFAPHSDLVERWFESPSWSPDGRHLAYAATFYFMLAEFRSELRVVDVDSGGRRVVFRVPLSGFVQDVTWSPDGKRIAFVLFTMNTPVAAATWTPLGSRADLFVINADGTGLRPLMPANAGFVSKPVWSPDSRTIAFTHIPAGFGVAAGIYTVRADAAAPVLRRVSPLRLEAGYPAWAPDGRRIAYTAKSVTRPLASLDELWVGDARGAGARRVARDARGWIAPAWSPDSATLAYAARDGVATVRASGGPRQQRVWAGEATAVAWSSEGDLAFATQACRFCEGWGIYVMRPGNSPKLLTAATITGPLVWSR